MKPQILTVVSARPQFVKASVLSMRLRELGINAPFKETMVHTGQHYDTEMSKVFFDQLQIPVPKYNLNIGTELTTVQAARVMERLTPILQKEKPDLVLVYGDTVSTAAAAYTTALMDIPLVHAEAGERVYRRFQLPEEVNRVTTDHLASLNMTCTKRASRNLHQEGMGDSRVVFVGDPMFDLFLKASKNVESDPNTLLSQQGVRPGEYVLVTVHRKENTEVPETVLEILKALDSLDCPVVFPLHPRTRNVLRQKKWSPHKALKLIDPLSYFDFIRFMRHCRFCVTDSGGGLKEAFFSRKFTVVPMESAAWPDIFEAGWAKLAGNSQAGLQKAFEEVQPPEHYPQDLFGDGNAADQMIRELRKFLENPLAVRWESSKSLIPQEVDL